MIKDIMVEPSLVAKAKLMDVQEHEDLEREMLIGDSEILLSIKRSSLAAITEWQKSLISHKSTSGWKIFLSQEFEICLKSYHQTVELWLDDRNHKTTVALHYQLEKTGREYVKKYRFENPTQTTDELIRQRHEDIVLWTRRALHEKLSSDSKLTFRHRQQLGNMVSMFTRIFNYAAISKEEAY